jgi:hypothetical protein
MADQVDLAAPVAARICFTCSSNCSPRTSVLLAAET